MSLGDFITEEHRQLLGNSFSGPLPFCRGVLPVTPNDLLLYYGKGGNARQISLLNPPLESLELLVKACDLATFGRNKEDVCDESYRKARKLNTGSFMVGLDVVNLGLTNIIRGSLVLGERSGSDTPVRAELCNLNVYGEGSFFKPHVDTPRGVRMFGSLVILFPTEFEGGELIMRRKEKEWSFDAANALAKCQGPHLAYVAFYSDVEHEVSMVKSGHRVSVTYNLYFDDAAKSRTIPLSPNALGLKNVLETLLIDPTFFPEGGWLGFHMEHNMRIKKCLKGIDAEIVRVAKELLIHVSLRPFVSSYDGCVAFKSYVPELNDVPAEDIGDAEGALDLKGGVQLHWMTAPESQLNRLHPPDVYGNESGVRNEYKSFCLFIEIGEPGMRTTPPKLFKAEEWETGTDSGEDAESETYAN